VAIRRAGQKDTWCLFYTENGLAGVKKAVLIVKKTPGVFFSDGFGVGHCLPGRVAQQ
jgi:hypothetical protein